MDEQSLEAHLEGLRRKLAVVDFLYLNSSWAMGPTYRERIRQIKGEIADIERILFDDQS